jgi:hypothetical protein
MSKPEIDRLGAAMYAVQNWFKSQCDGDWEHGTGVKIETLDNPGWLVTINLADTDWDELVMPRVGYKKQYLDLHYEVTNKAFIGSGGVDDLAEILENFVALVKVAPPSSM